MLKIHSYDVAVDPTKLKVSVRILFLSDLHLGFFNRGRNLRASLTKLAAVHAKAPFDLILLGGDYLDADPKYLPDLEVVLGELHAFAVPMYAVYGNHDHKAFKHIGLLARSFELKGIMPLRNSADIVEVRGQSLAILGLEDLEQSEAYRPGTFPQRPSVHGKRAAQMKWLEQLDVLPAGIPRVLISHNPDGSLLPAKHEPDLVLAGHTHGGQYLPLRYFGALLYLIMPAGSFSGWSGMRKVGERTLIVSNGLEGSLTPSRFLVPPSAEIITLHPSTNPNA